VAKPTRAQRRARRQQQAEPALAGSGGGAAKPPVRLAPQPPDKPERQPRERGGFTRFLGESVGELKKVEWPGQNQVIQGTVVVIVACIIVGVYLWLNDQLWMEVVQKVLLK